MLERLRDAAGARAVRAPAEAEAAGAGAPLAVVEPEDASAVAAVLNLCSGEGWGVAVAGATGRGRRGAEVLLRTRRLWGEPEHEPADLTAGVSAGVTLEELQATVAAAGQLAALDPPGWTARSVGGTIAARAAGPLQERFGSPRDQVLGVTLVSGDGRLLRLGGRVVKNVAGYDLVRLVVGSRGTLGVITHAHLRLFPKPLADLTLRADGDAAELAAMAPHAAALEPDALEIVAEDGKAALLVRFSGAEETVAWKAERLRDLAAGATRLAEHDATLWWTAGYDAEHTAALRLRWLGRPDRLALTMAAAEQLGGALNGLLNSRSGNRFTHAHAGAGEVRAGWRRLREPAEWQAAAALVAEARAAAAAEGVRLAVDAMPAAMAAVLEPAPKPDPVAAEVEERVRRAFDPAAILRAGG
jgi:glycolate oxidase FAD binding subunit